MYYGLISSISKISKENGEIMKKSYKIMPVLLLLISIALGVVTYICYKNESVFYTYLFIALVCSIILLLSELISQYRLQKHIKRGDFYENRLRLWNTISYRVKKIR